MKKDQLISVSFIEMFKLPDGRLCSSESPTTPVDMTFHELMVHLDDIDGLPELNDKQLKDTLKQYDYKILVMLEFESEDAEQAALFICPHDTLQLDEVRLGGMDGPSIKMH